MGQIKNIKLHIVTDIKSAYTNFHNINQTTMWWEALPGAMIIAGATLAVHLGITGVQWVKNGGRIDRGTWDQFSEKMWVRDERIVGNRFDIKFLDEEDSS